MNTDHIRNFVTMQSVVLMAFSIMMAAFASACSKKSDPADTPATEEAASATPTAVTRPVTTESRAPSLTAPVAAPDVAQTVLPTPFRVGAVIDRGEGSVLVGLISDETGYHDMVEVGDTFEGYSVVAIDPVASEVFLEREGRRYIARLSAGTSITGGTTPTTPAILNPEIATSFTAGEFEPTPDEIARGIDPNNPDTWPNGYRGPGIERAGFEEVRYEQTADEKRRGIDPNDPETWPSGYRGPGIERAMMQMQQED